MILSSIEDILLTDWDHWLEGNGAPVNELVGQPLYATLPEKSFDLCTVGRIAIRLLAAFES